jgi:hypothetical protein
MGKMGKMGEIFIADFVGSATISIVRAYDL